MSSFADSIIYTYRIILGDIDVTRFGEVAVMLVYTLFIICTVFNTIVMLNLLIAIISETFETVQENAENQNYQEKAAMIAENVYLIPEDVKIQYATKNRMVLAITDLEEELEKMKDENDDSVSMLIDNVKKKMQEKMDNINTTFEDLKSFISEEFNKADLMQEVHYLELKKKINPDQHVNPNPSFPNKFDDLAQKVVNQMRKTMVPRANSNKLFPGQAKSKKTENEFQFSQA